MAAHSSHTDSHMHDYEAHVQAVEEDLEYYRTKRLEPRVFFLARRGIVPLCDLLHAYGSLDSTTRRQPKAAERGGDLTTRIRALEDSLDAYVKGIELISLDSIQGVGLVIEDTRRERGDYDPFFRFLKRHREGSLEDRIAGLEEDLRSYKLVLDALRQALVSKGLVKQDELQRRLEAASQPGAWNGARIVARAWVDPAFKANLMANGRAAVRELGIPPGRLGKLGVAENTESVHNVVVCTLCSCYPTDLLGNPPWWYKHDSYKDSIVRDPRGTLRQMFQFEVPSHLEVRVHDSTSDVRWMVLPRRPPGTEAMSEEELAELVTMDSLVGTAEPLSPHRPETSPARVPVGGPA